MRFLRIRITTRRMMVLIGLLAIGSALLRIHLSLAFLAAGVLGLAFLRTCEKIDRARASGERIGAVRTIGIALASGLLGLTMIMAGLMPICLLPLLPPWHTLVPLEQEMHETIVIAVVFGTPIVAFLRRKLW